MMGPLSKKLAYLQDNLATRAGDGHPLSLTELAQLAVAIADLAVLASTMENQLPATPPLRFRRHPPRFRVIEGGPHP